MPSEWDEALHALGLTPPPDGDAAAPAAPSPQLFSTDPEAQFASLAAPAVGALAGGLRDFVSAPGKLAFTPNPYSPGSEEADYFERSRAEAGESWAHGAALGMLGAGGISVGREATLGAAGANKLLGGLKEKYPQSLSEQYGQFKPGESGAPAAPVNIWKTDPKSLSPGQLVQAGPDGPIGKFQGVSPGGTTLVNWKEQTASKFNPHSPDATEQALAAIEAALKGEEAPAKSTFSQLAEHASKLLDSMPKAAADLSDAAIAKQLEANPGASIFDLAVAGPSMPYKASPSPVRMNLGSFPNEVPYTPSEKALEQNYLTPAQHDTRLGESQWQVPGGQSNVKKFSGLNKPVPGEALGKLHHEGIDALRLPSDELGVHFGTPLQGHHFSGSEVSEDILPRTYPTVLKTGKSLETPDMGNWNVYNIHEALTGLHEGTGSGINRGKFRVTDPEAHLGEFPREERAHIDSIEDMRKYLASKGYDSVNYINKVEGPGARSYIMFKPSEDPQYVAGVRSRFAKFDPSKLARPELTAGLAATAASPLLFDQKNNPYVVTK